KGQVHRGIKGSDQRGDDHLLGAGAEKHRPPPTEASRHHAEESRQVEIEQRSGIIDVQSDLVAQTFVKKLAELELLDIKGQSQERGDARSTGLHTHWLVREFDLLIVVANKEMVESLLVDRLGQETGRAVPEQRQIRSLTTAQGHARVLRVVLEVVRSGP